jgi:hypothetical protein
VPPIQLDLHGMVAVDMNFRAPLVSAAEYEKTVESRTWSLVQHYASDLRKRQVRVAFFSATAYGRPDVYTRHALIRLSQCLGVDVRWWAIQPYIRLYGSKYCICLLTDYWVGMFLARVRSCCIPSEGCRGFCTALKTQPSPLPRTKNSAS